MLCLNESLFNETINPQSSRFLLPAFVTRAALASISRYWPLFCFQSAVSYCVWAHFSWFHLPSCECSNAYKMLGIIDRASSWVVVGGFFRLFNLTYTSFFGGRNPPHQWLYLERMETIWFLRVVTRNGNMRKECILNIVLGTDGNCLRYPFWRFVAWTGALSEDRWPEHWSRGSAGARFESPPCSSYAPILFTALNLSLLICKFR